MSIFSRLMKHDVTPISISLDGTGSEIEQVRNTEKGFFEYNERRNINVDGETVQSKGILFLKADSAFDVTATDDNGNPLSWNFTDVKNDRTYRAHEPQIIDDPRTGKTHHYEIILL